MNWNISTPEYNISGLGGCCVLDDNSYCGLPLESLCPSGTNEIPNTNPQGACFIGPPSCGHIPGATFRPSSPIGPYCGVPRVPTGPGGTLRCPAGTTIVTGGSPGNVVCNAGQPICPYDPLAIFVPASSVGPYCGVPKLLPACPSNSVLVPNATGNAACNVGLPNGTSCDAFPNSTYIPDPSGGNGYVTSGLCEIIVKDDLCSGCSNNIPLTKNIDLCQLAENAWNMLNSKSLNIASNPCV